MGSFSDQHKVVFKVLFNAVSEGIIVVDRMQKIVAVNQAANAMFGYEKDELIDNHLSTLIPQKYRTNHHKVADNFMANSQHRQMGSGRDLFGLHKDGKKFPVEAGLNPLELEGKVYVMAIVTDITFRKKQEQKILNLNAQLEEKIIKRTQELRETVLNLEAEIKRRKEAENRIKEALQKERDLNNLKTKFLSLVSHEFKTPLSGILTSTTLVGKYTTEAQQEKREKHLKTIKSKVKYLDNILSDFLSVERLEAGKVCYKCTKFPLSKVINEVLYDANMLLKQGQKINYPKNIDNLEVFFDEKILELVLTNLVNNAIKYSDKNTKINIEVSTIKDSLQIAVSDQGIGIPKKEQEFIFKRYFRAENALTNQGTGIGLNIAKNHIDNLKGSISFISIENEGSTFFVNIPYQS